LHRRTKRRIASPGSAKHSKARQRSAKRQFSFVPAGKARNAVQGSLDGDTETKETRGGCRALPALPRWWEHWALCDPGSAM